MGFGSVQANDTASRHVEWVVDNKIGNAFSWSRVTLSFDVRYPTYERSLMQRREIVRSTNIDESHASITRTLIILQRRTRDMAIATPDT